MPIYEYECKGCDNKFELRRGLADSDSEIKCPKCGVKHPHRIFSTFATGSSIGGCAPSAST